MISLLVLLALSLAESDNRRSLIASALMADRYTDGQALEDNDEYVGPGYYNVPGNEGIGYVSFYLDSFLLGEKHSAIHAANEEFDLVALNLDKLPSNVESVLIKDLKNNQDTLALININKPIEDEGSYARTATRAVYTVEHVPVMSVLRGLSARIPFSTSDLGKLTPEQFDTGNNIGTNSLGDSSGKSKWIPDCSSTKGNREITGKCYMNWDKENETYPNPIFDYVPFLIGGAKSTVTGMFVFDQNGDTIRAGAEINMDLEAKAGLHIDTLSSITYKEEEEDDPSLGTVFTFTILVLTIDVKVGFGVDYKVSAAVNTDLQFDYIYTIKVTTPGSLFIGYDNGPYANKDGKKFDLKLIPPETTLGDLADALLSSKVTLTAETKISPYFRVEFGVSVAGIRASMDFDLGADINGKMIIGLNKNKCTTFPYVENKGINLAIEPFARIRTPELKVWIVTLIEEQELTRYPKDDEDKWGINWSIDTPCLIDPVKIKQETEPSSTIYGLMVKINSFTTNLSNFARAEIYTESERCTFTGASMKTKSSNYCVLDNVKGSEHVYVSFYFTSIADAFGYINKYSWYSTNTINYLDSNTTLTKSNTKVYSDETNGTSSDISAFSISVNKFKVPESMDKPEEVDHTKGADFYSMLRIPAGFTSPVSLLLNIEDGENSFWTNGEVELEYYSSDVINSNYTYVYSFNPTLYTPMVFNVTAVTNNGWVHDLGMSYCLCNSSISGANIVSDCKSLSGDSIIDISGDPQGQHPIEDGKTISYPQTRKYMLNYYCSSESSSTIQLVVKPAWSNYRDPEPQAYVNNFCSLTPGAYPISYDDSKTLFNISKVEYRIPIKYTPPKTSYNVKSQIFAVNRNLSYISQGSVTINKINQTNYSSEYGVLSINITNKISDLYTNDKASIIIVTNTGNIDWLKPFEYLGTSAGSYFNVITTDITSNTSSGNTYYWINLPFRFKGSTTSIRFTLGELFRPLNNNPVCDISGRYTFVSKYYKYGCVIKNTNKTENQDEALIYRTYYSYSYTDLVATKVANTLYTLYYLDSTFISSSTYIKYTKYLYVPDSSVAVSKIPDFVGENYGNNVYTKVVSNVCYKLVLEVDGYKLELTNGSSEYIDGTRNSSLGSALYNGKEGTATCYCKPSTSTSTLQYDGACVFQVDESLNNKVYLLTSSNPAGIHINSSSEYNSSVIAYANSQFINFDSKAYYSFDKSGTYKYETISQGSITVNINKNAYFKGQRVVSVSVTKGSSSSQLSTRDVSTSTQLPISNGIFSDSELLGGLVTDPANAKNKMFLDSDGTLYIDSNYFNDNVNASSLTNICSPYKATEATIPDKCKAGQYLSSPTSSLCIDCSQGYYCVGDSSYECINNTYQPSTGQSACIACGSNSLPNSTRTSCTPKAGYYLVSGSFGTTNTAVVDMCPIGYSCNNGKASPCNPDNYEYSKYMGADVCSICNNNRGLVIKNGLSVGCEECGNMFQYNGHGKCVPLDGYYLDGETVKKCEVNHYCTMGEKHACPVGYYQPKEGSTTCIEKNSDSNCISDAYAYYDSNGISKLCPQGHYCISDVQYECEYNTIQPCEGADSCEKCQVGSKSNSDKTECIPEDGYYSNGTGFVPCELGHYCIEGTMHECEEDYIQPNFGMTQCTEMCPYGTTTEDHVICKPKIGYYLDEMTNTYVLCEPGYHCLEGLKFECSDGMVQPDSGKGLCEKCPELSSTSDHIECIAQSGYYINYGEVIVCPVGHSCENGQAIECGAGQYQDQIGSTFCKTCGNGNVPADINGNPVQSGGVQCVAETKESSSVGIVIFIILIIIIVAAAITIPLVLKKKGIICKGSDAATLLINPNEVV